MVSNDAKVPTNGKSSFLNVDTAGDGAFAEITEPDRDLAVPSERWGPIVASFPLLCDLSVDLRSLGRDFFFSSGNFVFKYYN